MMKLDADDFWSGEGREDLAYSSCSGWQLRVRLGSLDSLELFWGGGGNGLRKDCRLGVGMIWGVSPSRTELATLS